MHVADLLVRARGIGFAGEKLVPEVHPVAFELLGLAEQDTLDVLEEMENSMATAEDI